MYSCRVRDGAKTRRGTRHSTVVSTKQSKLMGNTALCLLSAFAKSTSDNLWSSAVNWRGDHDEKYSRTIWSTVVVHSQRASRATDTRRKIDTGNRETAYIVGLYITWEGTRVHDMCFWRITRVASAGCGAGPIQPIKERTML